MSTLQAKPLDWIEIITGSTDQDHRSSVTREDTADEESVNLDERAAILEKDGGLPSWAARAGAVLEAVASERGGKFIDVASDFFCNIEGFIKSTKSEY